MALNRRIFTLSNRPGFKWQYIVQAHLLKSEGGPAHADPDVETAYATAGRVYNFALNTFGRDSYNGGGRKVDVYIHRAIRGKEAEFYHTPDQDLITMCDGDGRDYNSTLASPDVLAHEMGHGYLQYITTLTYGYSEAGAILEHWCDVFAWLVRQSMPGATGSWEIAAGYPIGKRALRDLKNPGDGTLAMPGATNAGQIKKAKSQPDVYFNGGVLSRAFATAVETMGLALANEAGTIWYRAVKRLPAEGTLRGFRDEIYGVIATDFPAWDAAMRGGFAAVGL